MKGQNHIESVFRLSVGFILWGISSLLTAGLLLSFSGDNPTYKVILLFLSIGLEGSKILSWRMGKGFRVLAVSLIILSGLGSLGAALQTVESFRQSRVQAIEVSSPVKLQHEKELQELDQQISILLNRLDHLPSDYTTATKQLESDLDQLRLKRSELNTIYKSQKSSLASKSLPAPTMFDLLAQVLGIKTETLMLVILVFLAVNIEAGALILSGSPLSQVQSYTSTVTPQEFLRAAKEDADLPYLHGRDQTAQKLGISFYEAKNHVEFLKNSGQIKVVGKRLVLTKTHP